MSESLFQRPLFQRLALIGIGLIGSSVARIAKQRGDLAAEVVVTARTQKTLDRVAELGFADRIEADPGRAVAGADCVMLCAPVGAFADLAAAIAPHLARGAVLTDVGSTKQSVIRDVGPLVPEGVHFVPAHPVAGTEYSGPDAGFTSIVRGALGAADAAARVPTRMPSNALPELWRRCGSMVQCMEPAHHDRVLAIVSHLPHLIAFTICGTADDLAGESRQEVLRFAASGFPRLYPHRRVRPGDVARRPFLITARRCWRCWGAAWGTRLRCCARCAGATRLISRTWWSGGGRSGGV